MDSNATRNQFLTWGATIIFGDCMKPRLQQQSWFSHNLKLDRWGKNRSHGNVIGRDRMTLLEKTPKPLHIPRRAKWTGTDHQAGRNQKAHRSRRSHQARVHSEGIFLGGYRKFCPHRGLNSGRQAEVTAWPAQTKKDCRLNIAMEKVKESYRQPNILAEYIAFL